MCRLFRFSYLYSHRTRTIDDRRRCYFLEKESLLKLRRHIQNHPDAFQKIIKAKSFVSHFEEIKGEKNKRLPKEFQGALEQEPLIANKQFYYMAELEPEIIFRDDLVELLAEYCEAGKPFNDFLIEGMDM